MEILSSEHKRLPLPSAHGLYEAPILKVGKAVLASPALSLFEL